MSRSPAGNEHRCQDCIQQHGADLDHHARLRDAGAAQGGAEGDHRELQRERRDERQQILTAGFHRCVVGRHRTQVWPHQCKADDERGNEAERGEKETLVEHQRRVIAVTTATRLRDQCDRADAEHLRHGHDDILQRAGRADTGKGRVTKARDEVQVDQQIRGLKQHPEGHRERHLDDVSCDRALGEVIHGAKVGHCWSRRQSRGRSTSPRTFYSIGENNRAPPSNSRAPRDRLASDSAVIAVDFVRSCSNIRASSSAKSWP